MSILLEICLEETQLPPETERYIRCVALPGGEPGLALDRQGAVRWMPDEPADYGLWVSMDDQLILLRASGAGPIMVSRAGRSIEAPAAMPVVLLDQDLLQIDGRELRVHVHGVADEVHAPERLSSSALARAARATVAALALSAAVGVGAEVVASPPPIEVRTQPPARPARIALCDITAVKPARKGPTTIHVVCQSHIPNIGARGQLVDASTREISGGEVVVKRVQDRVIVVETPLSKAQVIKATRVRFRF